MKNTQIAILSLSLLAASAQAADRREIETRYASDKKLCAEEPSSRQRMQCLRDARAEYDRALAGASYPADSATGSTSNRSSHGSTCADCGRITDIHAEEQEGEGGAMGTIAGGVAGALAGSQVGQGTGRDLATIAGAVGGAYAGRKLEGKMKSNKAWKVMVRFDNGEERTYRFENEPSLRVGDAVKASGDTLMRR